MKILARVHQRASLVVEVPQIFPSIEHCYCQRVHFHDRVLSLKHFLLFCVELVVLLLDHDFVIDFDNFLVILDEVLVDWREFVEREKGSVLSSLRVSLEFHISADVVSEVAQQSRPLIVLLHRETRTLLDLV